MVDNEFAYELFAVCIHSGGAAGGHYYAYCKSFETDKVRRRLSLPCLKK